MHSSHITEKYVLNVEVSWLKNQDAMDIFGDVAIILNVNIKVSWASIALYGYYKKNNVKNITL